jgi:hypothetical protein
MDTKTFAESMDEDQLDFFVHQLSDTVRAIEGELDHVEEKIANYRTLESQESDRESLKHNSLELSIYVSELARRKASSRS